MRFSFVMVKKVFISCIGLFSFLALLYSIFETPKKFGEFLIYLYPYIVNTEDYRILLACFSILVITLINYPLIKYRYLDGKKKLGIQDKLKREELIEALSREKQNINTDKTYIAFDADNFKFLDSQNISSITDFGKDDFSFNFTKTIANKYVAKIDADKSVDFDIIEKEPTNVRILFSSGITGILYIEIKECSAVN